MPSGASADDSYAATDAAVTVVDSSQSAATFSKSNDFELVNFITEETPAMDRSQDKGRKRSSSYESARRAKRFQSSSEEEFDDDVVCDLNFGDYNCTDECAPYCDISQ